MKRTLAILLLIIPLSLIAGRAWANPVVGLSIMLSFSLGLMLFPIIILEAAIAYEYLGISFGKGLKLSAVVNLATAVIGFFLILPLEMLPQYIGEDPTFPVMYMICWLIAWVLEYLFGRLLMKDIPKGKLLRWSFLANSVSYILMALIISGMLSR